MPPGLHSCGVGEMIRRVEASTPKLPSELYEKELHRLQVQLVEMTEWVKREGARLVG